MPTLKGDGAFLLLVPENISKEIVESLRAETNLSRDKLNLIKLNVCAKYASQNLPRNSELLRHLRPDEKELRALLTRKITRTSSGVTIIAVMTQPHPCPHPEAPCAYCPGGPSTNSPQSYTGKEPAAMRGIQSGYNPSQQVYSRIEQLRAIGHDVDKVELIIMGGTFPSRTRHYQESFVKRCLDALNGTTSPNLRKTKELAWNSPIRNVGITVETRPDWAKQIHIDQMLELGVTRVELGVQNIYDDIYELVNRGHKVDDVVQATQFVRDSGLKVVYHMMPGLPGSNLERDLNAFETIFKDPRFKPDMLKIYPCLVLKGTKIHDWWLGGTYKPLTTEEAVELLSEVKRRVPRWTRIMRIQRDIPANLIEAGIRRSNLRELIRSQMNKNGLKCSCIRCREIGLSGHARKVEPGERDIRLKEAKYDASEGTEYFLSFEDEKTDTLAGFLRLRFPSSKAQRPEILQGGTSIVRELHVYGKMIPVGNEPGEEWQHKGYGEALLSRAEDISRIYGVKRILVTSGLGVKGYYSRLGYSLKGPYMEKTL